MCPPLEGLVCPALIACVSWRAARGHVCPLFGGLVRPVLVVFFVAGSEGPHVSSVGVWLCVSCPGGVRRGGELGAACVLPWRAAWFVLP